LAAGGSDYHGAPGLRTSSLGRPSLPKAEFERLSIAAAACRASAGR
jgi:hypothetical protein